MIAYLLANCPSTIEVVSVVSDVIVALSVLIIIVTYFLNRKQMFYSTVQSCQVRYVDIVRRQQELDLQKYTMPISEFYARHLILFRDHLGLIHEEIFYIQNGNLPKKIAYNWLGEMLKRVPVYDHDHILVNKGLLISGENSSLAKGNLCAMEETFKDFQSVAHLFKLTKKYTHITKLDKKFNDWETDKMIFAIYMYYRIRNKKCGWIRNLFCCNCRKLKKKTKQAAETHTP